MSEILNSEERVLLNLLCIAMGNQPNPEYEPAETCGWQKFLQLAQSHAVTAVLYDVLESRPDFPESLLGQVKKASRITVQSNYRLLFLTKYLTGFLGENGITAVTLKGAATASFYPVPEYRKSGDVDLLVPVEADYEKACLLLKEAGFRQQPHQSALHHTEFLGADGISVELHGMLAEPFESGQANQFLEKLLAQYAGHIMENTAWGVRLYQPSDAYHAFYLILHMLQHFLREGFGLKNLCDWTVFWNRETAQAEQQRFLELVQESGTGQFVRILTAVCVRFLGLSAEKAAFILTEPVQEDMMAAFLQEVLDAGEFGKSEGDRMVAMRGTGFAAYVQEFQHQMHLNYPRAGRIFVCWPVLWVLTLARFLLNNRRLHRASAWSILKKARRRSALTAQLQLFSKKE